MEIIEEWLKKRYTEKNKKSEKINEENFETSNQIIEQDVDDVFGLNGTNYGEWISNELCFTHYFWLTTDLFREED